MDECPILRGRQQNLAWLSGEAGVEYLGPAPNDFPATMAGIQARQQLKADADDPTLNPLDWALLRAKDLDG